MQTDAASLAYRIQEPAVQPAGKPPLLILLHGIGSNEDDLFALSQYLDKRFLIVSARAPLVVGAGQYAWFNIEFTPQGLVADLDQAEQSRVRLLQFIDEMVEARDADPSRVFLMGFSQGAMMSLAVALTHPEKVTGVVAMSGRLPSQVVARMAPPDRLNGLSIFVAHGIYDPVLLVEYGREARKKLDEFPVELTYREYPMGHEVSLESLRDITSWLTSELDRQRRDEAGRRGR